MITKTPIPTDEQALRGYIRQVYGNVFLRRVERLITQRLGAPFKFNHLTGPMIIAHPRFEPMMARWIKKLQNRKHNPKDE